MMLAPDWRAHFLEKLTGYNLEFALESDASASIAAFSELLAVVPEHQRKTVLIHVTKFGLENAFRGNHVEAIKAYGVLLNALAADERAELLTHVIKSGMEYAIDNRHRGAVAALGTLLRTVPMPHQKAACLPAEQFRQHNLFREFNAINPQMKSTFLDMLRDVDVALVDHFNQARDTWEKMYGGKGASGDTSESTVDLSASSLTKSPDLLEAARRKHQFMSASIRSAL